MRIPESLVVPIRELLERRMRAAGTIYTDWIDNDPDFDSIRDDPRFIALTEALNLLKGLAILRPDEA